MTENIGELLTDQSQLSAKRSYDIVIENRQDLIDVSHVFLALLDFPDEILLHVLDSLGINDVERLKAETRKVIKLQRKVPFWKGKRYRVFITPLVKQSIDNAITLSKQLNLEKASSAHIFWGVIKTCFEDGQDQYEIPLKMREIFNNSNLTPETVFKILKEVNDQSKDEGSVEKDG
jgi:ATP-dependent Clp protease ATP-binding subunit ClpA